MPRRLSLAEAYGVHGQPRAHRARGEDRRPGAHARSALRLEFLLEVGLELPQPDPRGARRSPAARRSASASRPRSAPASPACCTCSTSRRIGLHQRDNRRLIETLDQAARPRQHAHRGRARRGRPSARRTGSSTSARGRRARRRASSTRAPCEALAARRRLDHRRLPRPAGARSRRRRCGADRQAAASSRSSARARTTCRDVDGRLPARCARRRSPACQRLAASRRWSTASSTRCSPTSSTGRAGSPGKHTRVTELDRPRQGRARRPGADRAHPALEPRDLHGRVRPDPHAVLRDGGGEGARLPARAGSASTSRAVAARTARATARSRSR